MALENVPEEARLAKIYDWLGQFAPGTRKKDDKARFLFEGSVRASRPRQVYGTTGVRPKEDKWTANITRKGVNIYLGTYNKQARAVAAAEQAKEGWLKVENTGHEARKERRNPIR